MLLIVVGLRMIINLSSRNNFGIPILMILDMLQLWSEGFHIHKMVLIYQERIMKWFIFGLLCMASSMHAMETSALKMPSEATLRARLHAIGMERLLEKTDLILQLADERKYPLSVSVILDAVIGDYYKDLRQTVSEHDYKNLVLQTEGKKSQILEAILRDHPEALRHLKGLGLYQPDVK